MKNTIPNRRTTLFEGIEFGDTTMLDSGLHDIVRILEKDEIKGQELLGGIYVKDIGFGDFLVSYSNKEHRDTEKENVKKYDLENTQTLRYPRFRGEFEYKGRFYNILGVNGAISGEITDILYKGVVINTTEFINRNPVGKLVERVKDDSRGIIEKI